VRFERREEPTGTDSQTAAGVQWPLDLFRRTGRIQTADREVEATGFAASDRERTLAAQVRRQYGRAAAAARDLHVAEEVLAAATSQLDLVRARVASGRTPPLERDLLEVERQRVESTRLLLAGRVEVSLVELRRLLGMAPDEPLQLRDTIESLVAGSSAPPAVREAVALRPDIREAQARVALADARIEQATREGRVDVTLFADYMRMDAGFPQQGVGVAGALERVRGRFHYVAGGAMVTVPLFDRGQGRVAAARAGRAAADARRDAAELAARAEIAAARASDARAQQAMALYSDSIRALARQNHDVVRQAFDLGRATVFDVLSEQRRLLEIEQGYTAALREAWDARVALTRALGETR
jgi:cobalt-zinc-cadmium efflux system outer membrane protein